MDQAAREAIHQDIANSHDELEAAHILHRAGKYRQALSRAYYAVFYAATAVLGSKRIKRAKHSGVQSAFGQFFVKNKQIEPEYNDIYVRVREARELSDLVVFVSGKKPTGFVSNEHRRDIGHLASFRSSRCVYWVCE